MPKILARLLISEQTRTMLKGDGRIAVGTDAIRKFYADLLATGRTFDLGEQRPAMLRENLALTRLPTGIVTTEVARKQIDGTWTWVMPSIGV
jgi:hypothetical protein